MLDFEQFYLNSKAAVYHYLHQHMEDYFEIEDIAQETFVKAFEEWDNLQEHPNPVGWLMLTARNLCTGYYRHVYFRKEELIEGKEVPYVEQAYDRLVMEDLLENVYKKKDKIIAKKFFLDGDSIEEIASDLGVSTGSFRTKLYRMRRRLKIYIESCSQVW